MKRHEKHKKGVQYFLRAQTCADIKFYSEVAGNVQLTNIRHELQAETQKQRRLTYLSHSFALNEINSCGTSYNLQFSNKTNVKFFQ